MSHSKCWLACTILFVTASVVGRSGAAEPRLLGSFPITRGDELLLIETKYVRNMLGASKEQMQEVSAITNAYERKYAKLFDGFDTVAKAKRAERIDRIHEQNQNLRKLAIDKLYLALTSKQKASLRDVMRTYTAGNSGVIVVHRIENPWQPVFVSQEVLNAPDNRRFREVLKTFDIECPQIRVKISEGVWRCGDGTYYVTHNRKIAKQLSTLFSK